MSSFPLKRLIKGYTFCVNWKNSSSTKVFYWIFTKPLIKSILAFSITVWYSGLSEADKKHINRVMKNAGKIIGQVVPTLNEIFRSRTIKKCVNIMSDNSHPSSRIFQVLPSCSRLRSEPCKTKVCRKFLSNSNTAVEWGERLSIWNSNEKCGKTLSP